MTPLVMVQPPKKIAALTDAERRAFADRLFEAIARTVVPADGHRPAE